MNKGLILSALVGFLGSGCTSEPNLVYAPEREQVEVPHDESIQEDVEIISPNDVMGVDISEMTRKCFNDVLRLSYDPAVVCPLTLENDSESLDAHEGCVNSMEMGLIPDLLMFNAIFGDTFENIEDALEALATRPMTAVFRRIDNQTDEIRAHTYMTLIDGIHSTASLQQAQNTSGFTCSMYDVASEGHSQFIRLSIWHNKPFDSYYVSSSQSGVLYTKQFTNIIETQFSTGRGLNWERNANGIRLGHWNFFASSSDVANSQNTLQSTFDENKFVTDLFPPYVVFHVNAEE